MLGSRSTPDRQPRRNSTGLSSDDEDIAECLKVWESCPSAHHVPDPLRFPWPGSPTHTGESHGSKDPQVLEPTGPVISLNIGGEVFRATASTLRKAPFFDSMLHYAEGSMMGTTVDQEGRYFVDRPGELFRYILCFLRSGHWLLHERADDPEFVIALRDEATFYGLDVVRECLPVLQISEIVTVWQFQDDAALYVDVLEQTIREDPEHQGLFRLCKYSGGLPLDQATGTRRFKATSHSIHSVIAYFAMRGFALAHVVQGSVLTHTTSADGQSRSGRAVQYVMSRRSAFRPMGTPPNSTRS